jgi:hypothetical protein
MSDNKINVLVGANIGGLTTGLKEAASAIQKGGEQIQASSEKAAKSSATAFKTLQQEYRQTFKDSQVLAQQQGLNGTAFLDAAARAGEYKNKLGDVAQITKAMSSDTPVLTAALGVGQGLAGAFAAAQGAMALFGSDSKVLQETMLKVQASIALVSGLTALGGLEDAFVAMSATITKFVIPAMNSLKATMLANPVTAMAVAIAAVVTALVLFSDGMETAAENTKVASEEFQKFNKEVESYILTDKQRQIAAENEKYDNFKKVLQLKIAAFEVYMQTMKAGNQLINETELQDFYKTKKQLQEIEKAHVDKIAEINKPKEIKVKPLTKDEKAKKKDHEDYLDIVKNLMPLESKLGTIDGATVKLSESMLSLKQIGTDSFLTVQNQAGRFKEAMYALADEVGAALQQLAIDGFGQFAQMAGAALMGEDVDWGQAAAQMIGQIASTLGKGLIAMGIPLLFSPITAGEGALMIAGGGALMAVAGAFGTNKGSSRGSGGGSSPAPSANYSSNTGSALSFKPMSTYIEVGGQVRGNNLKISLINTDISNRRVK